MKKNSLNRFFKKYTVALIGVVSMLCSESGIAQAPEWIDPVGEYTNTMTSTFTVSDECVPSNDPDDIVAVFDIQGNIRGVRATSSSGRAFMTIRGEGAPESLYFKVYDASTDKVYNIYNYSITFTSNGSVGSPSVPEILNFDSNPQGVNAGADQEVFAMTTTVLQAEGSGSWSIVEGAGGSFVDASDPNTVFNGVIATKYILAWTLDNAEGCIGETDEVVIYFVLNEPENGPRTCNDGLDNDGDGLYDCEDPDCGQPLVSSVAIMDPTPNDCSITNADGSIIITSVNADSFSIDMGTTFQADNMFGGLTSGTYDVFTKNSTTGCIGTIITKIENSLDPIGNITEMNIMGPDILCMGLQDVNYSLDVAILGDMSWSYSGADVDVVPVGSMGMADFGMNATPGDLIATMSSACSSVSDTLGITFANEFLCSFSNCPREIHISTGVLESAMAPQVYRADLSLTTDAQLLNHNYEFTSGSTLEFDSGFSISSGLSFTADIKSCSN